MKKMAVWIWLVWAGMLVSCSEYTPKPRGYFRIDLPTPRYAKLPLHDVPYAFDISQWVNIELPPDASHLAGWINLSYPLYGAKIYCSYLSVTPLSLEGVMAESRSLVFRQARDTRHINGQTYDDSEKEVYAFLYQLDGESASPLQFTITDSVSHFFRGALLYDCTLNADSLSPVTQYIRDDIIELIQSFNWRK
ncbi:MAG: gliding motility protein GldD [Tannerellaceae bacterium]|jgi:gliding motility-associated lipoprotein GldD|nr:gliding motility protein GldD [Tannerellaceae bacterium]